MDYRISEDIKLVREILGINQEQLAKEIGVSLNTISRIESGETFPNKVNLSRIYNYFYSKKIKINLIKSMFYKENLEKNHVLLFHGAKSEIIEKIDIKKAKLSNDFGQGFYCGESYEQLSSFVSKFEDSCIYMINFDPNELFNIKYEINRDWMLTIAYFRGTLDEYKEHQLIRKLINKLVNVDYIIAPIVDNRMFKIIDAFISGEITDEQCKHCLAATNLGYQYVMISSNAINHLSILEKCFFSENERKDCEKNKSNDLKLGDDKVKIARIQYRGIGKYIDEVLK